MACVRIVAVLLCVGICEKPMKKGLCVTIMEVFHLYSFIWIGQQPLEASSLRWKWQLISIACVCAMWSCAHHFLGSLGQRWVKWCKYATVLSMVLWYHWYLLQIFLNQLWTICCSQVLTFSNSAVFEVGRLKQRNGSNEERSWSSSRGSRWIRGCKWSVATVSS